MANNNQSLILLSKQLHQKIGKLNKPVEPKKEINPWLLILVNFGLGFVSELLEIAATTIFGPIAGMVIGIGIDMGFNLLSDVITGQDPWSANNVIFNIVLPLTTIPGRIKGLSKIRKSKVLGLGDALDDDNLKLLSKKLNALDISDTKAKNALERKYNRVLNEFDDLNLSATLNYDQWASFQKDQKIMNKGLNSIAQRWNKFNNGLSMITNPDQAVQALMRFAATPLRKKWNKIYSDYAKKLQKKFFQINRRTLNRTIIPLNHTIAPWILGIKLMQHPTAIGWYHVCVLFDPKLTNKKPPVWLYNKSMTNIMQFINAPSAVKYYINNISWGWDIGRMIRENNANGILNIFNSVAGSSYISQYLYKAIKTSKLVIELVDKMNNIDAYGKEIAASITTNLKANLTKGVTQGVKGLQSLTRIERTVTTGQSRHIIRYAESKTKSFAKKLVKNYRPSIITKK